MLFSSTIFLFAFLPIVLSLHFCLRTTGQRNGLLLASSLVFYAWGEASFILVLLVSIAINFVFGLWIDAWRENDRRRWPLIGAVAGNLLLLAIFKYANFFADSVSALVAPFGIPAIHLEAIHLPLGISFFTFQALTYVADVYRNDAAVQRSPMRVALYISLFPQLIAGPIVRYREVAAQLRERVILRDDVAAGIRRFVVGLGKKVLIANQLAIPADKIFAIPADQLQTPVAWLGALCYSLQIYFDFSGYSDMAIGLGRMLGFRFPENFDRPYIAQSIREFWRRWHMTLSTFFRDYLYIPLGGNRFSQTRTSVNLFVVFLLCGLWHGASWSFIVWGLWHGGFLALERTRFAQLGVFRARPARHVYTLLVVAVGWVFFRCETLPGAMDFLATGLGAGSGDPTHSLGVFLDRQVVLVLAVAIVASTGFFDSLFARARRRLGDDAFGWARVAGLNGVLLGSAMSLAAGTHNPFIYFRF